MNRPPILQRMEMTEPRPEIIGKPHNLLAQEIKRGFSRLDDLDSNIGYLEARLVEVLSPAGPEQRVVYVRPDVSLSSPFTQRISTLIDRLEEQVARVENIQRRLEL